MSGPPIASRPEDQLFAEAAAWFARMRGPSADAAREQFELWSRMMLGTTIRELRHIRDVPRAAVRVIPQPVPEIPKPARTRTARYRKAS